MSYTAPKESVYFGKTKLQEKIYLTLPVWECGWHWSFGYLGNSRCHYHLSSYQDEAGFGEHRDINMFDALKADYELCSPLQDDKNLWKFCELVKTVYSLLAVAEIYKRGGSHYATNPCFTLLKNTAQYEHINFVLLPALFKEIDKIFGL